MFYKNTSYITKTFYGVKFKPGEVKEVPDFINDPKMIRVNELPKEPPVSSKIKSAPAKVTKPAEVKSTVPVESTNEIIEQGGKPNGEH